MIKSAISLFFLIMFTMPMVFIVTILAWVIHPAVAFVMLMLLGMALVRIVQFEWENMEH